jgi:outer membrane scaffolding protein for murein synthesis (MipA/OmpV family)
MKKFSITALCTSLALLSTGLTATAFAKENTEDDSYSGGFLKVGVGYKYDQNPFESEQNGFAIFVNGRYQTDIGLFIEAAFGANERQEGLNIGYNFYNTDSWNFDITTVKAFGETEVKALLVDPEGILPNSFVVDKRDASQMLGLRATGTFDKSSVQFLVAPLLLGDDYDDGIYASLWAGHSWQIKNWEVYATAGLEYRSENILDHYFEPSEALQNTGLAPYDASAGIDATLQVIASYPMSENTLFEAYARYTQYSSSITESPIIQITSQFDDRSEAKKELGILFSYVF